MSNRHQAAHDHRNRATGFSDADWGALEKRLSDTRDMLRDILSHLRKVLDNLKTAGASCQSAGRAWRKNDYQAKAGARFGHRQTGPAAGAQTPPGAAGQRFHASSSTSSSRFTDAGSGGHQSAQGASSRFGQPGSASFAGASRPGASAGAGAQAGFKAGASGQSFTGQAGAGRSSTGQAGAGHSGAGAFGAGSSARANNDRQAGNGFSWSWRTRSDAGQSSYRAGSTSQGGSASSGAGGSGASFGGSRSTFTGRGGAHGQSGQAGQSGQGHERRQEERHRSTGPGGGSSYQDYSRRNHKSPLGSGRMTLTQACALLCLTYPCTADDVKSAYRKQARRHHPDLGGDEEMMKSINQAYELALSWCSPLRGKAATWAA